MCAGVELTELGFSPMFASTYVSVLGSTASSASRIFSTGMSSLALLVDSTSFSFLSLPRCLSSCTAAGGGGAVSPRLPQPSGGKQHRPSQGARRGHRGRHGSELDKPCPISALGLAFGGHACPEDRVQLPYINPPNTPGHTSPRPGPAHSGQGTQGRSHAADGWLGSTPSMQRTKLQWTTDSNKTRKASWKKWQKKNQVTVQAEAAACQRPRARTEPLLMNGDLSRWLENHRKGYQWGAGGAFLHRV